MKKLFVYSAVSISILIYFVLTVSVLPQNFLSNEQFVPQPYLEATLSESQIFLGDSFTLDIISGNKGDYGDIHIVSVAFPDLTEINDVVEIAAYDFTQSPIFVSAGDDVGSEYSGGLESVVSQYPSIEAMTRPAPANIDYHLGIIVTPEKSGTFTIYVKSIDIPHTSDLSHYPESGTLDHQNEHVLVYSVTVN
ncbi:hypothetical protein [Nitrosopumilus sp.]|uniref:hypothetical protein n=1 Tax=Nitrosopumilus sp. TaxID=2024843 RepID=UPI00293026CD|nr:hypothetical protein [Nitrosopumilus sp.]